MKKKNRILIYPLVIMGMFLMIANSCKKDDNTTPLPVLTTTAISNIWAETATSGGHITSDGGSIILFRGVCWSTNQTPTLANSKTIDGADTGSFISKITGLLPNTTYYVRAYATNSLSTGYGNVISLKTKDGVKDIDGNIYNFITIGTQVWILENLNTSKYRNGDPIPNVTSNTDWTNLSSGAYCDYTNTPSNSIIYGKMYNYYAVADNRKIAPIGWHVPTDADWTVLTDYLGGESTAAGKIRESGNEHWTITNNATNSSGFTGLPGGYRYPDASFWYLGSNAIWWSTTEYDATNAYARYISNLDNVTRFLRVKTNGFSVRCVKD